VVSSTEMAEVTEGTLQLLPEATSDELKSETGADFKPLADALRNRDFFEADQITRDMLIQIAGKGAQARKFVYWTEVKDISKVDLGTMERLWLKYSDGKFGYSVQRRIMRLQKGDFENFCRKIDWNVVVDGAERKRRWFGDSEFIYSLDAAKGHLPLTSALRGTQLLTEIFAHPLWDEPEWAETSKKSKK